MTNVRLELLQRDPKIMPLGELVIGVSYLVIAQSGFAGKNTDDLSGSSKAWLSTINNLEEKYVTELNRREEEYRTYRR